MGLLDGIMNGMGAGPGAKQPNLGGTVAAGVLLALAVKAARQYQASHPQGAASQADAGRSFDPQSAPQQTQAPTGAAGGLGGLLGGLGGLLGGGGMGGGLGGGLSGGLGGLLGGLGGAGALGNLINQLQNKGLGEQTRSWIDTGQNQQVAPHQIETALGADTVQQLQDHTGLPRAQLLSEIAQELPHAVDQLTPNGQLPNDDELHAIAQQPLPRAPT
jgi:uncharacterized protein YidB (DUF937 family)